MTQRKTVTTLEISCLVHATEDHEKVIHAVRVLLPDRYIEEVQFSRNELQGYYKNPITLYKTRITDRRVIADIVAKLAGALDPSDRHTLTTDFGRYVDRRTLYLRFDKQDAYLGRLRLAHADPIRVKMRLSFPPTTFTAVVDAATTGESSLGPHD
jgi:RNA binding exosome subunit